MSKLLPALCALAGHLPLGLLQRTGAVAGWLGLRVSKRFARLTGTNLEQAGLAARLSDPDLYRDGTDEAQRVQQALSELEGRLEGLFERWTLLEDKRGD